MPRLVGFFVVLSIFLFAKAFADLLVSRKVPEGNTMVQKSDTIVKWALPHEPLMELRANGDILIHGRKAANDKEVVEGMRKLINGQCDCSPGAR